MKMRVFLSLAACCSALALSACGSTPTPTTETDVASTGDSTSSDTTADGTLSDGGATDTSTGNCCADYGAECGVIKQCTKSCGACKTGQTCNSQHKCEATQTKPLKKFGERCGQSKDCQYPADNTDQQAVTDYFDCINAQCEDGVCNDGVCTKACEISTDDKNNSTGEAGADGIEDVGATSECGGAVDGPLGTKFSCVQLLSPQNGNAPNYIYCVAESNFKPCKADKDCDSGDACHLQLIYGAYQQMCAPAKKTAIGTDPNYTYKTGNTLGQQCNDNPVDGDLSSCQNDFCSGAGFCLGFCATDADCVTAPGACQGGKCAGGKACGSDADCSAYQCKPNIKVANNPAYSASLCLPRDCGIDGDCGAGYFCRPFWNGVKNPNGEKDPNDATKTVFPAFQPGCQAIAANTVKPGDKCDPYVNSVGATKPGKACQNPYACVDGSCGSLCKKDSDCTADQKCGVDEIPLDVDNPKGDGATDGIYDFELSLDICAYLPKAKGTCLSGKDCSGESSYCKAFTHKLDLPKDATPVGKDTVGGVCVAPDATAAKMGEACGPAANNAYCQSGFCFNTQGQNGTVQPGFCGDYCHSHTDCPATLKIGTTDYKTICRSLRLGFNGTLADVRDDLWLPVCYPVAATNSLTDCSATKKCSAAGESCLPFAIASGPETKVVVEYLCASPGDTATKNVGELCSTAADATAECKAGLGCMEDSATGKGYCTALCQQNADCGGNDGMVCDLENQWIPRLLAESTTVVPICKKAKTCIPCGLDNDCAGSYACTNIGTTTASDGRCAPDCAVDADCAGKDGGSKCVAALGLDGKATGKKVCAPTTCK